LWNFTAWLESAPADPVDPLTVAARKLYAKDVKAREAASAIIDNTNPEHPLRIFADSC
jgi:uridine kinase